MDANGEYKYIHKYITSPALVTGVNARAEGLCAVGYMVSKRLESDPMAATKPNHMAIVAAKEKLAPLEGDSIPRLELAALMMGAMLESWI